MANINIPKHPSVQEAVELLFGHRPCEDRGHQKQDSRGYHDRPRSSVDLGPYFQYYQRQWEDLPGAENDNPTYSDFTTVVEQIKNGASRERIISHLQERSNTKGFSVHTFQNVVDLAARALTMVRTSNNTPKNEESALTWADGTFRSFLENAFPSKPSLDSENIMFPKTFNAFDIENHSGVLIEFTDNLADHLRLVRNEGTVLIFHHVSFLQFLEANGGFQLLPPELVKETLQTLSLLFPKSKLSSFLGVSSKEAKWLKATCQTWEKKPSAGGAKVDSNLFRCVPLPMYGCRVESYRYWHDRLVLLQQQCDSQKIPGKASKIGLAVTVFFSGTAWR